MSKNQINYSFDLAVLKSNIHNLRINAGMSISDVVDKSNLPRESIYRWENVDDVRCPSIESLTKICNLFNVDIAKLLFDPIPCAMDEKEVKSHSEAAEVAYRILIDGLPKGFAVFLEEYLNFLEKGLTDVPDVTTKEVTVVKAGYYALKIIKEHNRINKPMHFLTMFPNVKSNALRFVFPASLDTIANYLKVNGIVLSPKALGILTPSAMGAAFTIGYRQRFEDSDGGVFFVKEKPSIIIDIMNVVELTLIVLQIVIDKKKS